MFRNYSGEQGRYVDGPDIVTSEPLTEAAIAMANRSRDVMIVPRTGKIDATTPNWQKVPKGQPRFIGGAALLSAQRRAEALAAVGVTAAPQKPLTGTDRYDTAAGLAKEAFPTGWTRVYLVNGFDGADAAAAASLTDGPLLSVPQCGALPEAVKRAVAEAHPLEVVAIGGAGVVCDDILRQAAAAATPLEQKRVVDLATQHDHTCVVLTTGQVMCLRRSGEWVALPEQPESMASILVDGRDTESSFTALSRSGKLWTWEAAGPAAGVVTYAAPTAVAGPSGAVQRLAKGDWRTCVVLTGGVVSCRGTDSGGAATWVPVPGVAGAAPVTVLEDRVADGSMRMHGIFGEFEGRVTLLGRNVDALVGNACGMRGQVLGCGKPRWDSPNGFVAPAGTTVERVADTSVRLSDGRLYRVQRRTFPGPTTVEPVRGFGG